MEDVYEYRRHRLLEMLQTIKAADLSRASRTRDDPTGIPESLITRHKKPPGEPHHKRIGEDLARKYERAGKRPRGWMDSPQLGEFGTATLQESGKYLFQPHRPTPPMLDWGALKKMSATDGEFLLVLRDDAMAPHAPKGSVCTFVSAVTADPGDAVIVRDGRGVFYFRELRLRTDGGWTAFAYNPAYPSLHSDEDELTVVAVFAGIRTKWSRLVL